MSTAAILPVSSIDFGGANATASEQTVFHNVLKQLQQAVGKGNLTGSAALLHAVESLSPSSATAKTPLGVFLTSLATALKDGSAQEAQSALAAYRSASPVPANSTAAAATNASTSTSAAAISAGLIKSQLRLSLVAALLGPGSSFGSQAHSSGNASSNSVNSLIGLLQAAYPTASSSAAATPAAASVTPYDTLVASIQASLAGGHGTITPALAYLQATGNFVNTSA